ncbi:PQQ-binding-like beta-propeller repeat protein [Burkholderiaceae bacterium DAT-1]|nr:PQQ-binding-like beta-propeller repeat protein [Burkholderiaceae bacterium DAT-1]
MNNISRKMRTIPMALLGLCYTLQAAQTDISNVPLATWGGSASVSPNIQMLMDDSGSMAYDFLGDWVGANDNQCVAKYDASGSSDAFCYPGEVPYMSSSFNYVMYNPAVTYTPPPTGSTPTTFYPAATPTAVYTDEVDMNSGTQIDLTTSYPEMEYCTDSSYTNCARNTSTYRYPDSTYYYARLINSPNGHISWGNTPNFQTTTRNIGPYYFTATAPLYWCDSASPTSLTGCATTRSSTKIYPMHMGVGGVAAQAASGSIVLYNGTPRGTLRSITVGTTVLMNQAIAYSTNSSSARYTLGAAIVSAINANSSTSGYSAALDGSCTTWSNSCYVMLYAPASAGASVNGTSPTSSGISLYFNGFSGGVTAVPASGDPVYTRVDIVPGRTYTKANTRTDCTGTSCTYTEELQNFANWYQYYRTRTHMAKAATAIAFNGLTDAYNIGYSVTSNGTYRYDSSNTVGDLPIAQFNSTQKQSWYDSLYSTKAHTSTPLRLALARAGQRYAGVSSILTAGTNSKVQNGPASDPVTQSCQKNYVILATDGYWNDEGTYVVGRTRYNVPSAKGISSSGSVNSISSTSIGNEDSSLPAPFTDTYSGTLADVAAYYYNTNLRPSMACNVPVADSNSLKCQHMTTFTMGLGMNGNFAYCTNYATNNCSNDYNNVLQGTQAWPDPTQAFDERRVDDLWHAAVNGHGQYFSARTPTAVARGLQTALSTIASAPGSGAAAATSTLQPVTDNRTAYIASYTTEKWTGDLSASLIDLNNGSIGSPQWRAATRLAAQATAGTRRLYMYDSAATGADKKKTVSWNNLSATQQGYFDPNNLSQCSAGCPGITSQYVFNFAVLGQAETATTPVLRTRETPMGDIVSSQPVFVGAPIATYEDAGYSTFVTNQASRAGRVYVGANDGMLHAFDATNGNEAWAYIPNASWANMGNLADTNYYASHRFFVDGPITYGDVYDGSNWRTILVFGLGAGGRTYTCIDITDPDAPQVLWEFSNTNLGLTYGNPVITKLASGDWVVMFTSGINNADGVGRLFILNAVTGTQRTGSPMSTGTGDTSTPSGLSKISAYVYDISKNNTVKWVYGGDLAGNMWRFDVNGILDNSVFNLIATGQPISVAPEIGLATSPVAPMVLFGTGRYLGVSDISDTTQQSFYSVSDYGTGAQNTATATINTPRNTGSPLIQQTVTTTTLTSGTTIRTTTNNAVNLSSTVRGCYFNLLDSKERMTVDPSLQYGVVVAASTVPQSNACTPGGYGWIYQVDYKTCGNAGLLTDGTTRFVGKKITIGTIVGTTTVKLPNNKVIIEARTSNAQNLQEELNSTLINGVPRAATWREILQ